MDPGTAGTAGFLLRLVFIVVAAILALRVAGLNPGTLAVGGAVGAVVLGLAAQQTLGNVIAGIVLIGVRPFKVGDRVRLQAGSLAGQVEGVVSSLGLLYTTLAQGGDLVMVPPIADADGPRLADEVLAAVGAAAQEENGNRSRGG